MKLHPSSLIAGALLFFTLFWGHKACGQEAGSKIQMFAYAIGRAEGFGVRGTIPTRYHNPGDIRAKSAHEYPGQVGLSKKRYAIFRNDAAGWAALYNQIEKILLGESRFYGPQTNIRQFSKRYAEVNGVWLKNVCKMLSISPNTTLLQYFNRTNYVTQDEPLFDFNNPLLGAL